MRRFALVPLMLCLGFDLRAQPAAPRRGVTAEDYFSFVFVADPRLSPDGSQVAYVSSRVDKAKNRRVPSIWVVATDGRSAPRMLLDETWSASASPRPTRRTTAEGQALGRSRPVAPRHRVGVAGEACGHLRVECMPRALPDEAHDTLLVA